MLLRAFCIGFAAALIVPLYGQTLKYYPSKQSSLRPLLEVLAKAGVSGSLEFTGRCESQVYTYSNFPEFPPLRAPTGAGGSVLQIVRGMFADDPTIQVTQDKDGTIRMVERGVATDILSEWIEHVSFENAGPRPPVAIFSAGLALMHLKATPEVQRFMKSNNIEPQAHILTGPLSGASPPPTWPHISGSLDNVTFSQAMDYILRSFPGIWWYQNCPARAERNRRIYFGFYDLNNIGFGVLGVP